MVLAVVLCMFAWQRLPDLPAGKAQHACESCGDSIYVAAGGSNGYHVSTMYRYDFPAGAWFECAPAPAPVQSPVMRCVNGKLYFIGGHDSTKGAAGGKISICAEYDPIADQWSLKAPMPTAREDMGSAVIGREIWVFGGLDNRGHDIATYVEVYDTATDTWTRRTEWMNPRCLGDFACTDGHIIYLICGTDTMNDYPDLRPSLTPQAYVDGFFYDLPSMPEGHCYTEVELLDKCIYVLGGSSTSFYSYTDRVDRFDTRRQIWLPPLQMPYLANGMAATQHRGRLYITGGWYAGEFLRHFYVMDQREPAMLAQAKYGGGYGTAGDPYQIWTAEQMNAIGTHPEDWDRHFKLMMDIDLSGFDGREGRPAFSVIAPDFDPIQSDFQGTPFTGVFDGDGHTISHLTIRGEGYLGLFGLFAREAEVMDLCIVDVNVTGPGDCVGGLIGSNEGTVIHCSTSGMVRGSGICIGGLIGSNAGAVTRCWSTSEVRGMGNSVGGLVGANSGDVIQCYAEGVVRGKWNVGGLAGQNWGKVQPPLGPRWTIRPGTISDCYSTSAVRGEYVVGGLIGDNAHRGTVNYCYSAGPVEGSDFVGGLVGSGGGGVARCFWDTQVSGQPVSAAGAESTTDEMHSARTFLEAGWDFAYETDNGAEDVWWIPSGRGYPGLVYRASCAYPYDGATDILDLPALRWIAGKVDAEYDVYFGDDESLVAAATVQDAGAYRGRQPASAAIYDPGTLAWDKIYYWRIDGVNTAGLDSPWKGRVWRFSTADFIVVTVVDDFESYTDDVDAGTAVFQTWIDGVGLEPDVPGNGTGSLVGNPSEPFTEQSVVHSRRQSMPMSYNNASQPWYSRVERSWETPQDWTADGADTLTLYFKGEPNNSRDRLYVAVEDEARRVALVPHRDPQAVLAAEWQKWHIPLADLQAAGVNTAAIQKLCIGVGDSDHPQPGGTGKIYIDDIRLTKRMQ